jgi:hypothetical protein
MREDWCEGPIAEDLTSRVMSGCHRVDWGRAIFGITDFDLIGGQLAARFLISGLYEDIDPEPILGTNIPNYIATWASTPRERPGATS